MNLSIHNVRSGGADASNMPCPASRHEQGAGHEYAAG
jgi:hypothetical protein